MRCPVAPCASCPYRQDVPSGLWAAEEYAKLPGYDEPQQAFEVFHCHQELQTGVDTVCRGWLATHPETAAARLAVLYGYVDDQERYRESPVPLWPTGRAAAEHGLRDLTNPSRRARRMMARLDRARIEHEEDAAWLDAAESAPSTDDHCPMTATTGSRPYVLVDGPLRRQLLG